MRIFVGGGMVIFLRMSVSLEGLAAELIENGRRLSKSIFSDERLKSGHFIGAFKFYFGDGLLADFGDVSGKSVVILGLKIFFPIIFIPALVEINPIEKPLFVHDERLVAADYIIFPQQNR
jgi:hypothetical protein